MKQVTGTRAKLKNYHARLNTAQRSLAMCQRWSQQTWAEEERLKIKLLTRLIREAEQEPASSARRIP